MQHNLYSSVDEMLAPETMSELSGQAVTTVQCRTFDAVASSSGSRFLVVETNEGQGPGYILKRVSLEWDWIMRATDDQLCRSVTIWQYGLLDRLPAHIGHSILACARDGPGWAILMRDISEALMPDAPFSQTDNYYFLDALATLHAKFWQASDLADPALGLCELQHLFTSISPQIVRREAGELEGMPQFMLEGWGELARQFEPDIVDRVHRLHRDPQPLCNALARYPETLARGDLWRGNLGLQRGARLQVFFLDWQFASAAPPTLDLAWYLIANTIHLPISKEAAMAYYRRNLALRSDVEFSDTDWQAQLELGLLAIFLVLGWAISTLPRFYEESESIRAHWQADIAWWSERLRSAVKRL